MPDTILLEIATPERLLVHEQVSEVQVPALNGYIGVLPLHAPLLSEMGTGELSYVIGGRKHSLAVDGGWVEVMPEVVRILVETGERAEEIDTERARRALDQALAELGSPRENLDAAVALAKLKRAQARLDIAKRK